MATKPQVDRMYVEVTYLVVAISDLTGARAGGSGCTRMYLDEVPHWLFARPGTLIVSILQA